MMVNYRIRCDITLCFHSYDLYFVHVLAFTMFSFDFSVIIIGIFSRPPTSLITTLI
jgi:hypothetical protein